MAPLRCPIDGKPHQTCTSPGYVPPLPAKTSAPSEDDDPEVDRRRVADPAAARHVFVNRPANVPIE